MKYNLKIYDMSKSMPGVMSEIIYLILSKSKWTYVRHINRHIYILYYILYINILYNIRHMVIY